MITSLVAGIVQEGKSLHKDCKTATGISNEGSIFSSCFMWAIDSTISSCCFLSIIVACLSNLIAVEELLDRVFLSSTVDFLNNDDLLLPFNGTLSNKVSQRRRVDFDEDWTRDRDRVLLIGCGGGGMTSGKSNCVCASYTLKSNCVGAASASTSPSMVRQCQKHPKKKRRLYCWVVLGVVSH